MRKRIKKVITSFVVIISMVILFSFETTSSSATGLSFTTYTNNCPNGEDWKHEFYREYAK